MSERYDRVEITGRELLREWLTANNRSSPGIWAVTHTKSSGGPYVSDDEVVDEAIAHGWIDSTRKRVDEQRMRQLLTPRKPKSGWSRVNKKRVLRLEREGVMTDDGRAAIATAKENGAWTALDEVENLTEPEGLREALDETPGARGHWEGFPPSAKRAILLWISTAKRDETRDRRIAETARLAAKNVRANQRTEPGSS